MFCAKLLPLMLVALLGRPVPAVQAEGACNGCTGSGATASASGGSCGSGFVSITVTVFNGKCKVFQSWDPPLIGCAQMRPCTPQVNRSWSGLSPGSDLEFCVTVGNDQLCLTPPPTVGPSGGGSDQRDSAEMGCTDDPNGSRSFSISSPSCGLSASVNGSCSGCNGF